ncbi:uncharacterized protein V1516DRAFT_696033 [Lipomyces oligophaga]|uniref:uncharacterized protein n=1 Tax=Lipomyces oligophaga TaxID=45792 RepID=UPI0034CF3895
MAAVKPVLKTSTSSTPPIASFVDASGNEIPLVSFIPDSTGSGANSSTSTPRTSTPSKKKTVSFHQDTKPPSIETPTRNGSQNPLTRRSDSTQSDGGVPSSRQEYAMLLLDYLMILIPLTAIHVILDVFVYRQYAQEFTNSELIARGRIAFAVLFVLHATFHPTHSTIQMQMFLLLIAVIIGSYMVIVVRTNDYFAVMKQAPPLGTILIWLAVELEYYFSITAAVTVGFVSWCTTIY